MSFEGRVALVTGGSRGIGRAIALKLAEAGANVLVNFYVNREAAEKTAAEIEAKGVRSHLLQADLRDPQQIKQMFEEVQRIFGGLDILINNAASGVFRPAQEITAKHWDWMMNINARAFLLAAQEAAGLMRGRGGGKIVSISSIGSSRVFPFYAGLGASKAALEALTRYLAVELAPFGIAVNAVSGGLVETETWSHFPERDAILAAVRERTPAGRILKPEEIAHVVLFLCSPQADMIRGQVIVVDGGLSLLV
ncbi:MAG: enoyl-[acyl-carrier-protein] reductase FabL [candidate division NC10 bacterium]|nr:enoyl-[acyl-carrier-protein] reductase FabL [candidate division NC10 bacterium]